MIFETFAPKQPLTPYIESIFHFKHFIPDHSIERVVPTGHIFIIFELDGIERHTFDNVTLKPNATYTKVWVSGMHRNFISISAHHDSEMFVIQFKPCGAHPFFHFPLENLNERVVHAEEILGEEMLHLHQEIKDKETSEDKFMVAEAWLKSHYNSDHVPPTELLEVVEKLQKEPCTNYTQAIESYPNTQKHLIDQCKKYLGLTPKYYQRIVRFNEIFQQMQKKDSVNWSQIAYQCGYSDQSHFIKEFRHFSGFNPQEFIRQEFDTDEANFFPLDR